jgi:uncharacterized protein (TIGR02246 family)
MPPGRGHNWQQMRVRVLERLLRGRYRSGMAPDCAGDVAAELTSGLAAAWNQHDMRAFASLFHDDAAFVNVAGAYMRGHEEIERIHAGVHAGPFRNSTLTARPEDARSLGSDVVVTHVRSELHGDDRFPGQVRQTLMTLVIERRGAQWKIVAAHNTNVLAAPG